MQGGDSDFDLVQAEVSDAGTYVQLTAAELIAGVRSLDADISRLLEGWKGSSAAAYRAGWDETREGAQKVLDSLETLAKLLGVVGVEDIQNRIRGFVGFLSDSLAQIKERTSAENVTKNGKLGGG
ncbi:WXG100 family type VII secretion target [Nocardia coubleae]|uniref:WXG100 family type VII secretion target n=1 Tax=Nocardia coubleae TaxID=356147 RepID=A0A846WCX1_9NOCA|nr:WXG100 family type VII secretion target [Nocardia coubleae]NKX90516.1 WXG100 family type VII secretion target [Nocardia coubleae]